MTLVQIAPSPPGSGGVGDFADKLALGVRTHAGLHLQTIVPNHAGGSSIPFIHALLRRRSSLTRSLHRLDATQVLLHYVGYGYARYGIPWDLVRALIAWRREKRGRTFVVFFHELAAVSPLFSSVLLVSALQRHLIRLLVRHADTVMTSSRFFHEQLRRLVPSHGRLEPPMPVFSTIGEPSELPSFHARRRAAVVFGSPTIRGKVYADLQRLTRDCETLKIDQLIDIGRPLPEPPQGLKIPWHPMGPLPDEQVIDILSTVHVGFLAYWPTALEKSSIFAAYSACGLPTILYPLDAGRPRPDIPVLIRGSSSAFQTARTFPAGSPASASAAAYEWYQTHNLVRHVERIARIFGFAPRDCQPFDTSRQYRS